MLSAGRTARACGSSAIAGHGSSAPTTAGASRRTTARSSRSCGRSASRADDLADALAAAVLDWQHLEVADVELEAGEERVCRRTERATVPVLGLERYADAVARRAEQSLGAALGDPAGGRLHQA